MAKPIFLIGCPRSQTTAEQADSMLNELVGRMPDYHVFVYAHDEPDFKFEVLNGQLTDKGVPLDEVFELTDTENLITKDAQEVATD